MSRFNFFNLTFGNGTIHGTINNNLVFGSFGNDNINVKDGDDIVFGLFGDDKIVGGPGKDIVQGGDSEDDKLVWNNGDGSEPY
ncbi:hypothetical protein ROLI_040260 [Roseobacter fucihabitans]|uniref:Calcium-binding protein n=1 Tax=Roseobacter fucihabitans TaxID=1537242 RepID=A0ABZ2BXY0_9RHOB|nr:hypothetical protein [Roseobacter litoralis]MBC6964872.1 hypothetical protein [Roseobacter litoralis]